MALAGLDLEIRGGCPVAADDLDPSQWQVLGVIREEKDRAFWQGIFGGSVMGGAPPPKVEVPDG